MQPPELKIKYAYPLDENRRRLFTERELGSYPSFGEIRATINEWRSWWEHLNGGGRIFSAVSELTGVNLTRDHEMYVIGAGLGPLSIPFIVPIWNKEGHSLTKDEFTEIALHELLHRYVGDPDNHPGITKYWEKIREQFSQESVVTQNHLVIFAGLRCVLSQLFGAKRLDQFMHPKHPEYQRALTIVGTRGTENILRDFRSFVSDVADTKTK